MKKKLLIILLPTILFFFLGCKNNCVGFRDEPMLTFTTKIHTPVEIYYKDNNNQYLGTMDSGSNVIFGIDAHYTGMNFMLKYPSGSDDVFGIGYTPTITFQNKCDYQIYLGDMYEVFTKRNIYKNYYIYKSPERNDSTLEEYRANGYTIEFR